MPIFLFHASYKLDTRKVWSTHETCYDPFKMFNVTHTELRTTKHLPYKCPIQNGLKQGDHRFCFPNLLPSGRYMKYNRG